jgi:ubiquinone/menaquinone biosynthesis C-methylase UbiE
LLDSETAHSTFAQAADYEQEIRKEWALFAKDPARFQSARSIVTPVPNQRVLDIGCGAGQELRPYTTDGRAFGVGIDLSPQVGRVARELFALEEPGARVAFARAAAERLPFGTASFDVVICRLALPYTNNATALEEMSRVLRPGGTLVLKIHHARYYVLKFQTAVKSRHWKSAIHSCRVLVAGTMYHVLGFQPRGRITGGETFQTLWLLRRELGRRDLQIERLLGDSVPAAPTLLVKKRPSTSNSHEPARS